MRKMCVWQGNYDGRTGRLVAATTKKEAARLMEVTMARLNTYFSETGNAQDIATALSAPGVVWERSLTSHPREEWQRVV